MQDDKPADKPGNSNGQGFLATLLQGLIRDMFGYWLTVLLGTGAAAIVCLYYGIPQIYSLLGGVLVLAVYIAWDRL